MWLLFVSSKEVGKQCPKWQKYSQPVREESLPKTASQTKKGTGKLFLRFDKKLFLPQKSKKARAGKKDKHKYQESVIVSLKRIKRGQKRMIQLKILKIYHL